MTGSISSATDVGTLNAVLYNSQITSQTIATLTAQASSGLVSSDYAGLGAQAGAALDLSGQLAVNTAQQNQATEAATTATVAQTALGQIQSLVTSFASQLLGPSSGNTTGLPTLVSSAASALQQVASLLNTKVGDVYIFAGQDSRTPPIPNASQIGTSAFFTAIQTAVAALDTSGAAAVQGQVLAAAGPGATSPFSASLEASNLPSGVEVGQGQTVLPSVLADRNTNAVATGVGTTSTGSYTRDILLSLATVASLGGANPGDPQVQSLLAGTQVTLGGALGGLTADIAGLGERQQTITAAQSELSDTATALTGQLGAAQDADPATVATKLAEVQAQLQDSYKIIANLEQLSLAKFL
jgi:flagellar hook-associated protein 3 FlgL